jgi:hypothetical protein
VTTYRVGEAGATVFDADGKPVARLRPGYVVVEGTIDTARAPEPSKRLGRYSDKKIRPESDK